MPLVLRKIRKAKWYRNLNVPWLQEGELQADALSDLETKNNVLSVWIVEDDLSDLQRIAIALAANGDYPSELEYCLLDASNLADLGIKVEETPGDLPDEGANNRHRNLVELSADKLFNLAKTILAGAEIKRIPEKQVQKLLAESVMAGRIDPQRVRSEKMRAKIEELISRYGA